MSLATFLTSVRKALILLLTALFLLSYLDVAVPAATSDGQGGGCCMPEGTCRCSCCNTAGGRGCCAMAQGDRTQRGKPSTLTFKRGRCTSPATGTVPQLTKEFYTPAGDELALAMQTQRFVPVVTRYHFISIHDAFHPPKA